MQAVVIPEAKFIASITEASAIDKHKHFHAVLQKLFFKISVD
jgi:hypothetical protein